MRERKREKGREKEGVSVRERMMTKHFKLLTFGGGGKGKRGIAGIDERKGAYIEIDR